LKKIHKTIFAIKQNTKQVPQILELAIANYTNCDELSKRVNALENPQIN